MQLVVVIAVRKAVSAATITFTATSMIRFFITNNYPLFRVDFDQLLFEFNRKGAMWLHCSVCLDPKENRYQAIMNYRV